MQKRYGFLWIVVAAVACGGGEKKTVTPVDVVDDGEYEEDNGDVLIPEEKFEEIKRTFERKASSVARCFPEAVESGEVEANERIKLTIGLVIQPNGSPSEMKILGASKRSATLEACVIRSVGRWEFTTLPKPLQYSYGFVMQGF